MKEIANIPQNAKFVSFALNNIKIVPPNVFSEGLTRLSIADNNLSTIDFGILPSTIQQLDLGKNNIHTISNSDCLKKLEVLILCGNKLRLLPKFNDIIKRLDISKNDITKLENCPPELSEFDCCECNLSDLTGVSKKLIKLFAHSNKFNFIISLPEQLIVCDISHNNISYLGKIPKNMKSFDVSHNELKDFNQETPQIMTKLDISHNKITKQKLKDIVIKNEHIKNLVSDHGGDEYFNLFDNNDSYWDKIKTGNILGTNNNYEHNYYGNKYNKHKYNYNNYNYNNYTYPQVEITQPKPYMAHNESNSYYIIHKREVKMSDILKRKEK